MLISENMYEKPSFNCFVEYDMGSGHPDLGGEGVLKGWGSDREATLPGPKPHLPRELKEFAASPESWACKILNVNIIIWTVYYFCLFTLTNAW